MGRIQPLDGKQWPAAMREALAAMTPPNPRYELSRAPGRPKGANILGTLAHHPELARAFFTLNGHLLRATTLTERQRELLILRVAAVRGFAYEWAQHLPMARDAGLTDAEIAWVAWGPDAPVWSAGEAALLRSVDELIADGVIGEATWATLAAEFDTRQILDAIFTVGAYETLGWMINSLGVELDADIIAMLRPTD